MKKAIIIEDEIGSLNVLLNALNKFASETIRVVGVADSIADAKKLIANQEIDIAFMDIVLKDGTSFDLLDQLKDFQFKLVFVTAYDKFAVEAFRFSAIDYLLKPLDTNHFEALIRKLTSENNIESIHHQYELFNSIRKNNIIERVNKIALPTETEIIFESLDNILYFQAKQNYTIVHTKNSSKYTMSKNLGYYDDLLNSHANFFRVHHSIIINITYIVKIIKNNASNAYVIEFADKLTFPISQRRLAEFKKLIQV
jgi:two-component system, LytTR family, response regulator